MIIVIIFFDSSKLNYFSLWKCSKVVYEQFERNVVGFYQSVYTDQSLMEFVPNKPTLFREILYLVDCIIKKIYIFALRRVVV